MNDFIFCDRPMERIEAEQYAKTFAGQMEELGRQSVTSGDAGIVAVMDQAEAHMSYLRDASLGMLLDSAGAGE